MGKRHRSDRPLPLGRLRGRGQLSELRQADLRFTAAETSQFLQRTMGLTLSDDLTAALTAQTGDEAKPSGA
jgi:LuxR family maltose regulon positive regulatory protein